MRKLELKHLAPYLPYGLKVIFGGEQDELLGTLNNGAILKTQSSRLNSWVNSYVVSLDEIKPILRPLSDIPNYVIENIGYKNLNMLTIDIISGNLPIIFFNDLVKNHYDVFGLIGAGLAIDINTLPK